MSSSRLFLLRHAKAGHPGAADDHARPLTERGKRDAARLGSFLKNQSFAKEKPSVLCSDAARTRQTYDALCEGLGQALSVSYDPRLYLAGPNEIITLLQGQTAPSLLVIGHNPGIHQCCLLLAGAADPELLKDLRFRFPTAAMAEFSLGVSWRDLEPGAVRLEAFHLSHRESAED
ncbi:MAG: histidine phosphatase family protein [Alphaproteobacteria bacterium]|nr:histidine phosphatase family protein [Alphaproteobacteria bacterium]